MSLYATINNFIAENAIIFSIVIPVLTGVLCAYLSYCFTVNSEKRKEFNIAVEPFLIVLKKMYDSAMIEYYDEYNINDKFILPIKIRMSKSEQNKFDIYLDKIISDYNLINDGNRDAFNSLNQKPSKQLHDQYIASLNKLSEYIKLR